MRKKLKDLLVRFRDLVVEYGVVALVVHYVIFATVITGFWFALRAGWQPSSTVENVGSWTAAYILTKVVQPLRIIATLAITPLIAKWYEHRLAPILARSGIRAPRASRPKDELP